jgi:hypothetical protein
MGLRHGLLPAEDAEGITANNGQHLMGPALFQAGPCHWPASPGLDFWRQFPGLVFPAQATGGQATDANLGCHSVKRGRAGEVWEGVREAASFGFDPRKSRFGRNFGLEVTRGSNGKHAAADARTSRRTSRHLPGPGISNETTVTGVLESRLR